MATLYSFTSSETNSNYNWNTNTDNYAATFVPTTTGIPTQLVLRLQGITGTPTADFYIRNQNTASGSTTYGSATGITLTSGTNTITLTGGAQITSGNTYYLWLARTSDVSNYPVIYYLFTGATQTQYRSTAANADPTTNWFTGDISMDINGTAGGVTTHLLSSTGAGS